MADEETPNRQAKCRCTSPTVYPYPPDSSIAMTTDAWHTWCSQPGALDRFALPLGHNPPLPGRLKYLQLGGR